MIAFCALPCLFAQAVEGDEYGNAMRDSGTGDTEIPVGGRPTLTSRRWRRYRSFPKYLVAYDARTSEGRFERGDAVVHGQCVMLHEGCRASIYPFSTASARHSSKQDARQTRVSYPLLGRGHEVGAADVFRQDLYLDPSIRVSSQPPHGRMVAWPCAGQIEDLMTA
jgi:hypothetical protein